MRRGTAGKATLQKNKKIMFSMIFLACNYNYNY